MWCNGFISILKANATIGETINIGSNSEISILDTLILIKEIMNSKVEFVSDDQRIRPEKSEVFRLCCDNKKIKNLTNFSSKHSIQEGLMKTIDWINQPENLTKYKANIYNV